MDSPNQPYDSDGDVNRHLNARSPPALNDNAAEGGNGYGLNVVNPTNVNREMDSSNNNITHNNDDNNHSSAPDSNNNNKNNNNHNHEAGPSGTKDEVGFQWVQPGTLDCSGCNVVNQIYANTEGLYNITIAVHGEEGHYDHLVFVVENTDPALRAEVDAFHFELRGRPLELTNSLLENYSIHINPDGSIVLNNSLLNIYNRIIKVLTSNGACPSEYAFLYDSDLSQDWFKEITESQNQPPTEFGYVFEDFDWIERQRESRNIVAPPTAPEEVINRASRESDNEKTAPPQFGWVQGNRWVEGPGESSNSAAAAAGAARSPSPPLPPPPAPFEWEEAPPNAAAPPAPAPAPAPAPVPAPADVPAPIGPHPEFFSRAARPGIAVQRERTANMTLMDLAPFFHMTARDAADELNISTTTLKLVCRRLNLYRWPYRKVRSIDDRIRELVERVEQKSESDSEGLFILVREIERLRARREQLYEFLTRHRDDQ